MRRKGLPEIIVEALVSLYDRAKTGLELEQSCRRSFMSKWEYIRGFVGVCGRS